MAITSRGKPVALLVGVDRDDLEETLRLLEARQAQAAVSRMRRAGAGGSGQYGPCGDRRRDRSGAGRTRRAASGQRVVLDTNVVVSALPTSFGAPARVLDLALAGELVVAYDDRVPLRVAGVAEPGRYSASRPRTSGRC